MISHYCHRYSETSDKDTPKEDNLPTKDKLKVFLYTHSIENHLMKEDNLSIKDKMACPKGVLY